MNAGLPSSPAETMLPTAGVEEGQRTQDLRQNVLSETLRRTRRVYAWLLGTSAVLLLLALTIPWMPLAHGLAIVWSTLAILGLGTLAAEFTVFQKIRRGQREANQPLPLTREETPPIDFDAAWRGGAT